MENVNLTPVTEEVELPKAAEVFSEEKEAVPVKKTRKPRTETAPRKRSRDVEELINIATKNMTDKEKENLIDYLKSDIHGKEKKIKALQNNCEQAYAKLRMCEDEYNAMERYYKDRLGFIDQQVTAFGNAVKLSIVGGLN